MQDASVFFFIVQILKKTSWYKMTYECYLSFYSKEWFWYVFDKTFTIVALELWNGRHMQTVKECAIIYKICIKIIETRGWIVWICSQ